MVHIPYIIESTYGLDRTILALLCESLHKFVDENGKERSAISKFRLCLSGNFYLCPERTEYEDSLCGGSACCDCGCDFEDFSD